MRFVSTCLLLAGMNEKSKNCFLDTNYIPRNTRVIINMRSPLKSKLRLWPAPLLLLLVTCSAHAQPDTSPSRTSKLTIPINAGWQFREAGKDVWHTAEVPGCVHTDLLANRLIDDPFYRDNEQKQQWIGKTDWEYKTHFAVTQATLSRENIELVFEGLDTYADVYLNDTPILKADNMFRTWRVDGKRALKLGDNVLRVHFRSPVNEVLPVMARIKYELPASNDQGEKTSPYTRKAPYQYGWDWGPRFVTSGIWRPVSLEAWDKARLSDVQIITEKVAPDVASLTANVEVEASEPLSASVILVNQTNHTVAGRKE